mgnify:FL=1
MSYNKLNFFKTLSLIHFVALVLIMFSCHKEMLNDPKPNKTTLLPSAGKVIKLKKRKDGYASGFAKKRTSQGRGDFSYILSKHTKYMVKVYHNGQPINISQNDIKLTVTQDNGEAVAHTSNGNDGSEIKFTCEKTALYHIGIQNRDKLPLEVQVWFKSRN